jgi:cytidine deaminase
MKQISIPTHISAYKTVEELTIEDKQLIEKAKEATNNAWAPYSGFRVGAAVLLENGVIVIGNNQENAAYPSGLCAERVALFAASAQYPGVKIKVVAICALKDNRFTSNPITPCGSCRQVISELNYRLKNPMRVILYGEEKIFVIENSNELLPLSFDSSAIL